MKQLDFNLDAGRELRDEGIASVSENSMSWHDKAFVEALFLRYLDAFPFGFISEDIRQPISDKVGNPHHPNAWGALTMHLEKAGYIRKTGEYRQMRLKSSHARSTPVYKWAR